MDFPPLNAVEVRVLGSLVEKQVATPDYYPLSLNALTLACNQLSNRDPVVAYDEATVVRGMDGLRDRRLATLFQGGDNRVAKYRHALTDAVLLTPAEVAILCVLMLRGPQTIGELRTRTERLFVFGSLGEVEETLQALANHAQGPLAVRLPRQPGTKEPRHAHLLGGPVGVGEGMVGTGGMGAGAGMAPRTGGLDGSADGRASNPGGVASGLPSAPSGGSTGGGPGGAQAERLAKLEEETAAMRGEIAELKREFAAFRKQFE